MDKQIDERDVTAAEVGETIRKVQTLLMAFGAENDVAETVAVLVLHIVLRDLTAARDRQRRSRSN